MAHPELGRRIHWLGKKELFDWPVVGWAARNGGVHPVDRGAADVEAFRLAKRILDEGHVLFVFPEGTRSPDGALQAAQDGVAVLAIRTGAPIVPLGDRRLEPASGRRARSCRTRAATSPSGSGARSASPTSCPPGTDRRDRQGPRDDADHGAHRRPPARRRSGASTAATRRSPRPGSEATDPVR